MQIKDHQITLFYFINKEVDLTSLDHTRLINTELPDELLERWITSSSSKHAKKPLWQEYGKYNISRHLTANIHELFHSTNETTQIIKTYRLTDAATYLLNGKQVKENASGETFQLIIDCNDGAQQRLRSAYCEEQPQLNIEQVFYHQFKSGAGVICVTLQLANQQLHTSLINEAVYNLSKVNLLCWQAREGEAACNTQTTLGKIMRQLVNNEEDFEKTRRVYTNAYIQYTQGDNKQNGAELIDQKQKNLIRLARHRSLDYSISDQMIKQSTIFKDYDNIRHCITSEGIATFIVINNKSKQFLQNYYDHVIKQVHIPLYLLAFHAREVILRILDKQIIWQENSPVKTEDIEILQSREKQLLNLNRTFFLDVISDEEIHNKLHQALIHSNHLQSQYKKAIEVTHNTLQMMQGYQIQLQQKEVNKAKIEYCKIAKFGISIAAIPTTFTFFNEFLISDKTIASNIQGISISVFVAFLVFIVIQHYCHKSDEPLE